MACLRWLTAVVASFGAAVLQAQTPSARAPVPGAPAEVTAFVDVTVVPMDAERVLPNQTVLVAGGWITALGPVSQVKVPKKAVRIDGRGKYLIPGLAEMHGHLYAPLPQAPSKRVLRTLKNFPPEAIAPVLPPDLPPDSVAEHQRRFAERQLGHMVAQGITTLRNMNAYGIAVTNATDHGIILADGASVLQLRARAAAGELWSPRIYTTGQWAPDRYYEKLRPNPPLDSIAAFVAAYKAAGYDFLKVRQEPLELFDSLTAAARRVGIPVVGHMQYYVPLEQALAGMRSIEHPKASFRFAKDTAAQDEVTYPAAAAAARQADVWLCFPNAGYLTLVKYMQEAGVGLLLGTDGFGTIHAGLQSLVEKAGLTPYQALAMGTKNVAVFLGTLDSTGTVAVGKRADLVLLDGNPLQEIAHTERIAGVMLSGQWSDRTELDRRLAVLGPWAPQPAR